MIGKVIFVLSVWLRLLFRRRGQDSQVMQKRNTVLCGNKTGREDPPASVNRTGVASHE
jgi:hypothetical protein